MKEFKYILIENIELKNSDILIFSELLKKQNKVKGNLINKAKRCKSICFVKNENKVIAIGGIKPISNSVFSDKKANLIHLKDKINWELGYFFTEKEFQWKKIGSNVFKLLFNEVKDENLMSTTELSEHNPMLKILINNGFLRYGNSWKSDLNTNNLVLFLKL